jgi:hypothetical protein
MSGGIFQKNCLNTKENGQSKPQVMFSAEMNGMLSLFNPVVNLYHQGQT